MTESQEIIMPIWKEYWHEDKIDSKELVVKIWNAAILASANKKSKEQIKALIIENTR